MQTHDEEPNPDGSSSDPLFVKTEEQEAKRPKSESGASSGTDIADALQAIITASARADAAAGPASASAAGSLIVQGTRQGLGQV